MQATPFTETPVGCRSVEVLACSMKPTSTVLPELGSRISHVPAYCRHFHTKRACTRFLPKVSAALSSEWVHKSSNTSIMQPALPDSQEEVRPIQPFWGIKGSMLDVEQAV